MEADQTLEETAFVRHYAIKPQTSPAPYRGHPSGRDCPLLPSSNGMILAMKFKGGPGAGFWARPSALIFRLMEGPGGQFDPASKARASSAIGQGHNMDLEGVSQPVIRMLPESLLLKNILEDKQTDKTNQARKHRRNDPTSGYAA